MKRKTKCDQKIPCSACIKRGDPKSCEVPAVRDAETMFVQLSPRFHKAVLFELMRIILDESENNLLLLAMN